MVDLTPPQRKALIEAVTEHWGGLGDAWDNILGDNDREDAAAATQERAEPPQEEG